ncbi:MAG: flagellar hook-associated protein FlgL [bacterium]
MRVTFPQINNMVQRNLHSNYFKLFQLQEQLSSGRRINRPSDDPVDMKNNLQLKSKLEQNDQFHRNLNDGLAWLSTTENTLTEMNEILHSLREEAVKGATDTNGPSERKYIAKRVRQLLDQLVLIIDSNFKGKYIFSGTQTNTMPYQRVKNQNYSGLFIPAGGQARMTETIDYQTVDIKRLVPGSVSVTNQGPPPVLLTEGADYEIDYARGFIRNLSGMDFTVDVNFDHYQKSNVDDAGEINREVEENILVKINISATEVFEQPGADKDAVGMIMDFIDALEKNQGERINSSIGDIDTIFEKVLAAQSSVGSLVNRFEQTRFTNESREIETTRLQSELEDVDIAEVMSQFSMQQSVYTASLQAGARVILPTLGDFIG